MPFRATYHLFADLPSLAQTSSFSYFQVSCFCAFQAPQDSSADGGSGEQLCVVMTSLPGQRPFEVLSLLARQVSETSFLSNWT